MVIIYNQDGSIKEKYTESYANSSDAKPSKKYSSDGQKCTRCYQGVYSGGFCDICSSPSSERMRETINKLPKCDLCNGTGREYNFQKTESRTCPMCEGKGYRTY